MDQTPFLDRLPPEVTENIAEHLEGDREGLEAFRALRLTCKEVYLKTFRVFAINYFTDISVAFNAASLRRLQELAGHQNSFGLSLTSFPQSLTCSTYRLPTGNSVRTSLITISDPNSSLDGKGAAKAISRACQRGTGSHTMQYVHSPCGAPHLNELAYQYMVAVDQQESMEATGLDVKLLAEALAAFPHIRTVRSQNDHHTWGQEDWETLAGISMQSFLSMEYLQSGETNITIATRKLLAAIAQASVLRRSQGSQLIIEQLYLHGVKDPKRNTTMASGPCPRGLQLHKLDISNILHPLRDAFSHLKVLHINICRITKRVPGQLHVDSERQESKTALETLTCNPAFEELLINFFDKCPTDRAGLVHNHSSFITKALVTQRFANLRSFKIFCPAMWNALPFLSHFVCAHAGTLTELQMATRREPAQTDVSANRQAWRPVLQAAATCAQLAKIFVVAPGSFPWAKGTSDVEIYAGSKERVAAVLARLVCGPTEGPGKELGWVTDGFKV